MTSSPAQLTGGHPTAWIGLEAMMGFGVRFARWRRHADAGERHDDALPATSPAGAEDTAASDHAIVEVTHVSKRLGDRLAVDDVSFAVDRGELFALIGPSGSGKTSTVRVICGIYAPDDGAVRLWNQLGAPWPRGIRNRIGYMPQSYSLYPRMTAAENLRYAAALHGIDRVTTARRLAESLELVDLTEQRNRLAGEMSGGQRRRLALALALMHDPELLFIDEPTAGLDPVLRVRLWAYFRQLTRRGRTVVVTTQYIDEAELTDRVAIMRAARLVALGSPGQLAREAFGGEIVELRSANLSTQAARALTQIEGIRSVEFSDLDALRVIVDEADVAAPRLLAALAREGCTVRAVSLRRPRFEDVFLRLTGVAPRPESPEGDNADDPPDASPVMRHVFTHPSADGGKATTEAGEIGKTAQTAQSRENAQDGEDAPDER